MTKIFQQSLTLIRVNQAALWVRVSQSLSSILGIAFASALFLSLTCFIQSMEQTLANSGQANSILVMRQGASAELLSVIFPMEIKILANHENIEKDQNNQPIVAPEMLVTSQYQRVEQVSEQSSEQGKQAVSLRGISSHSTRFRPNFKLTKGNMFTTGLTEIIVGQAFINKNPTLDIGSKLLLGDTLWTITGIFSDNHSQYDSELWADITVLQSLFKRGNSVQSVRLLAKTGSSLDLLKQQWQQDPRLNIQAQWEQDYFAKQSERLTQLVRWIGFPLILMMAIGTCIAAINNMYANIDARIGEIATHKALGFNSTAIALAIIVESIQLALVGGTFGIIPVYFGLNEFTASTENAANMSQLMFQLQVTLPSLINTLLVTLVIGLIGGLLPAIKALRMPVVLGLKH